MGSAQPHQSALPSAWPWLQQAAAQAGVLWAEQPAGVQDPASILPHRDGCPRTGWGGTAQHGSGISTRCPVLHATPCRLPVPWHPSAMGAGTQEPGWGSCPQSPLAWEGTLPHHEECSRAMEQCREHKAIPQTSNQGQVPWKTTAQLGHQGFGWQLGWERCWAERSHDLVCFKPGTWETPLGN